MSKNKCVENMVAFLGIEVKGIWGSASQTGALPSSRVMSAAERFLPLRNIVSSQIIPQKVLTKSTIGV